MILTVCVRLLFYPLAQKQYESLTKMKKLQPQMEELRKNPPAKLKVPAAPKQEWPPR